MTSIQVGAIVLGSATVAGFTGFGFSLIALPLLALIAGPQQAVVTCLLISAAISGVVVLGDRSGSAPRTVGTLILAGLPGIVLGTIVFEILPATALRALVSLVTLACAYLVRSPNIVKRAHSWFGQWPVMLTAGFLSGACSSAAGINGPPVVAYLSAVQNKSITIRSSASLFVLLASTLSAAILAASDGIRGGQVGSALSMFPVAAIGSTAGTWAYSARADLHRVVSAISLAIASILAVGLSVAAAWQALS